MTDIYTIRGRMCAPNVMALTHRNFFFCAIFLGANIDVQCFSFDFRSRTVPNVFENSNAFTVRSNFAAYDLNNSHP